MFELMPFDHAARRSLSRDPFAFNDFFAFPAKSLIGSFSTDIVDNGDSFELEAELPGMDRENISLKIEDGTLVISAEKKLSEEKKEPNFVRRERFYGSYNRSFSLDGIDADAISASYADGVLKVKLPKLPEQKPEGRYIEIE